MDLWIRTQNKDKLLKVSEIKARKCDTTINIVGDNVLLAQYSTKEKTMAVMDEIQKALSTIILTTPTDNYTDKDLKRAREFGVLSSPNQTIFDTSCVVYTMPEDVKESE